MALSSYPPTFELMLRTYEPVKAGQGRLIDIIVGFVDPNAPDVVGRIAAFLLGCPGERAFKPGSALALRVDFSGPLPAATEEWSWNS